MNKKNLLLAIVIPAIASAVLAFLMTPSPEKALKSKLTRFEKLDNIYYSYDIGKHKFEQYKANGEYYAEYFHYETPIIINTKGNELKFGTSEGAVITTIDKSKSEKSLFWLDKIVANDIKKNSAKRVKSKEGDVYSAELNDGTPVTITFFNGMLNKIEYKDVMYHDGIIKTSFDETNYNDLTVTINHLKKEIELPYEMILDENVITISADEFESYINSPNNDYLNLKTVYTGDNYSPEEEYEDYEYSENEYDEIVDTYEEPEVFEDFEQVEEVEEPTSNDKFEIIPFEELDTYIP